MKKVMNCGLILLVCVTVLVISISILSSRFMTDDECVNIELASEAAIIKESLNNQAVYLNAALSKDSVLIPDDAEDGIVSNDLTLTEDVYYRNLNVTGGTIDLNGFNLTIYEHLIVSGGEININNGELSVYGNLGQGVNDTRYCGNIRMNGGKLTVYGNYTISTNTSSGLFMQDDNDYVLVYGDFSYSSMACVYNDAFTSGTLEIKGNLSALNSSPDSSIKATGTHKLVLSGRDEQIIETSSYSYFANTKIENPNTVFERYARLGKLVDNSIIKSVHEGIAIDLNEHSLIVVGDLIVSSDTIDINNGCLIVYGSLTQSNSAKIRLNGGQLIVYGDYANYMSTNYGGGIYMNYATDYMYVGGDFVFNSVLCNIDDSAFTDGIMVVKGDFTVGSGCYFIASGHHTIIISGSEQQIIKSNGYSGSCFNKIISYYNISHKIENITYSHFEYRALCNHSYNEWIMDYSSTPYLVGYRHHICSLCSDVEIEEISKVPIIKLYGAYLTLQNNLKVNFIANKSLFEETGYENPYAIIEMNGTEITVTDYFVNSDYYVFSFSNIAPDKLNDTITATLYAEYNGVEYSSEEIHYSIAQYCYSMLGRDTTTAKLRTLLVDLLHYGAASQMYTGYNTDSLVDASLTEEQLAWGTLGDPELTSVANSRYYEIDNPAVVWKGVSLYLYDSITMQFFFTASDINGIMFKIENQNETVIKEITEEELVISGSNYVVKFKGLTAGEMSETVYVTAYNSNGEVISNTVTYSIESYAHAKQNDTNTNLANLVKTMMKYGNSAHHYIIN